MNGKWWSLFGFISITVVLAKHGSLFKDIYFVQSEILATRANDSLKLNNAIKSCFLNLSVIFYYVSYIKVSTILLTSRVL